MSALTHSTFRNPWRPTPRSIAAALQLAEQCRAAQSRPDTPRARLIEAAETYRRRRQEVAQWNEHRRLRAAGRPHSRHVLDTCGPSVWITPRQAARDLVRWAEIVAEENQKTRKKKAA